MIALRLQEWVARVTSLIIVSLYFLFLKYRGYTMRDVTLLRKKWRQLMKEHPGPWIICPNHLTMIDSLIVTYGLFSFFDHFRYYMRVPWNLPEQVNFYKNFWLKCACYLAKCIPIRRGGSREEVLETLAKCHQLLREKKNLLIFPEGGRSRTGRINQENFTYGVGRFVDDHPDCRVLCVYLRGDDQVTYSYFPVRGERFTMLIEPFVPVRTGLQGLRAQRDYARQIIYVLARMEEKYFAMYRERYRRFDFRGEPREERESAVAESHMHVV